MRNLQLGEKFAVILAWNSFIHLPQADQRHMFAVFRAHTELRSVLMFTSGPSLSDAIGSFQGEPLYHSSLSPVEYEMLLRTHGSAVAD